jgi:hypothetical protein
MNNKRAIHMIPLPYISSKHQIYRHDIFGVKEISLHKNQEVQAVSLS